MDRLSRYNLTLFKFILATALTLTVLSGVGVAGIFAWVAWRAYHPTPDETVARLAEQYRPPLPDCDECRAILRSSPIAKKYGLRPVCKHSKTATPARP